MHFLCLLLRLCFCLLSIRTYREYLNNEYEETIKSEKDLDDKLREDGIDATQREYKILKGFWRHLNFVFAVPSDMDKRAVAEAYYAYYKSEFLHGMGV